MLFPIELNHIFTSHLSPSIDQFVVFRAALNNQWLGIFVATVVVWIGATIGAMTAFVLGRFVLRDKVASYKEKYGLQSFSDYFE